MSLWVDRRDGGVCVCLGGDAQARQEAEAGVAMETIVFPSHVIGAAGMSKYLLFLPLFNTSDKSAVTDKHKYTQNT